MDVWNLRVHVGHFDFGDQLLDARTRHRTDGVTVLGIQDPHDLQCEMNRPRTLKEKELTETQRLLRIPSNP